MLNSNGLTLQFPKTIYRMKYSLLIWVEFQNKGSMCDTLLINIHYTVYTHITILCSSCVKYMEINSDQRVVSTLCIYYQYIFIDSINNILHCVFQAPLSGEQYLCSGQLKYRCRLFCHLLILITYTCRTLLTHAQPFFSAKYRRNYERWNESGPTVFSWRSSLKSFVEVGR